VVGNQYSPTTIENTLVQGVLRLPIATNIDVEEPKVVQHFGEITRVRSITGPDSGDRLPVERLGLIVSALISP
jgi:hypothetical protein